MRTRLVHCLCALAALLLLTDALVSQSGSPVPFTRVTVDPNPPTDPHCKAVGDIDGDGYPDIVAAADSGSGGVYWYQYPNWTKRLLASGFFTTDMQLADIDNDGDLDVVIPSRAAIVWFQNPLPSAPVTGIWASHTIGVEGASNHDVEVGDINRDGKIDVVTRKKEGNSTFVWLQNNPDSWTKVVASTRPGEGTALGDLDRDGDLDIAHNGFWVETPADPVNGTWVHHDIAPGWPLDVGVHIADINGDGRLDVALAPSESANGRLVWYESATPRTGPWTEHVVDATVSYIHTFKSADIDGDGDLDLVTAEMHQSDDPDEVSVYYNGGGGLTWTQQVLATSGSHNIRIGDIDRDGDIDIVGANWNHVAPNGAIVELWRNERNPARTLDSWQRHVIDSSKPARSVFVLTGDLDRDGKPDIVTGGWWYRNPGSAGGSWTRNTVGSPFNNVAEVVDYDGDGSLDLLGTQGIGDATNTNFAWARNNGQGVFTVLTNLQSGQGDFLQGAVTARFQAGGPLETALSWHASPANLQFLTTPATPSTTTWPWRATTLPTQYEGLTAGDIDRDGDLDLLLGTVWLRNDGGAFTSFTLNPVSGEPDRNRLADVNRDGRLDAVVGFEVSSPAGKLAWYEQPASATGTWTEHVIGTGLNPLSVDAADMDGDGDIDVVVGEHNLSAPSSARLIVFENADGLGGTWTPHLVYVGDEHHDGARVVDIDGDGDLDIVSIGWGHSNVLVYENRAILSPGTPTTAAAPSIDPGGGTFFAPVQVTLSTATNGASIFYTTNGADPTQSSTPYTAPFQLAASATVRARAFKSGLTDSPITSAAFTISGGGSGGVTGAGLKLWLRADAGVTQSGGAVSQWLDQSGAGRNATQPASLSYPQLIANAVNGRPALSFDGANDFLTFNLPLNGLTGMTIAMVSANSTAQNGTSNGVANAPLFWNETADWGTVHLSPFQNLVQFRFGTTQANNAPVYNRPTSAGSNFGLALAMKNGATETLYLDGQLALTATGKLPSINGIRDTGNIGRGYNDNTYFAGRIAEIVVYDRALTDAERQALDLYLRSKYFGASGNLAPTVNAGADQSITLPASATLSGSVSDDGQPNSTPTVAWSKQSGPGTVTFGNASAASTTATFSAAGDYVLRLTANDGALSSFDELTVTVKGPNAAPTVNAGADQTVVLPAAASLSASVSDDGQPNPTPTVVWSKQSGPGTVTFGSASAASTTATFSTAGDYVLRLTANDGALSAFDELTVFVRASAPSNTAPTVNAGSDQTITLPASATLSGTATDDGLPSNSLTVAWSKQSGPGTVTLANAAAASTTATFSAPGTYVLRLTANDGALSASDDVAITVNDSGSPGSPVPSSGLQLWLRADAGVTQSGGAVSQWADQSAAARNATQTASASYPQFVANAINGKPALAFDGANDFLTFNLPLNGLTGMTMVLVSANTAAQNGTSIGVANAPLFWNESGDWGTVHLSPFQSVVKFRFGTRQANNLPSYTRPVPVGSAFGTAIATKNGTVETLHLDGQLALTATGKVATLSGIRDTGNIGRGYNDNTWFAGRIAEILVYDRALSDSERQAVEQYLRAKYFPAANAPPSVNAGPDQSVTLPAAATLAGSATDDGLPSNTLTVAWTRQSGPGTVTFANPAAASTTATFSAAGQYVLRLTANDGAASPFDEVTVNVTDPGAPAPVVPSAGLKLWLRADAGITQSGGAVSQWADQSGEGRHATQTVAASYPQFVANAINGKPALSFDGANDFLTFNLPLNGLTGMTMILVSANAALYNGSSNGVSNAPLFWNETSGWGTVHLSPFQSVVKFRFGTTQANNLPNYTRPGSVGTNFGLAIATKNGATETLHLDGQLVLTATGKLSPIAGIRDTGNLARGYNDNTYFSGRIAEVLVYDRALTAAERQAVEQYLMSKYFGR